MAQSRSRKLLSRILWSEPEAVTETETAESIPDPVMQAEQSDRRRHRRTRLRRVPPDLNLIAVGSGHARTRLGCSLTADQAHEKGQGNDHDKVKKCSEFHGYRRFAGYCAG